MQLTLDISSHMALLLTNHFMSTGTLHVLLFVRCIRTPPLTQIFGLMVHLDTVLVIFDGQGLTKSSTHMREHFG